MNCFNHCPTPIFQDTLYGVHAIGSIGGMWSVDLWNPRYAAHIFKVTVAVEYPCLFNLSEKIVWKEVVKERYAFPFQCCARIVLSLHLVSKRHLLVFLGASLGNGELRD